MSTVRVRSLPGISVLSPTGSLMGGAETEELDAAFRAAQSAHVPAIVLNLADVPAMNSVGVGLLAGFAAAARAAKTRLAVCCAGRRVEPIFKLVALPEWRLFATESEAVQYCTAPEGRG